jgi:hypothetical protein
LLRERIQIEDKATIVALSLWHERLAQLDTIYNYSTFINTVMDLPEDHQNSDVIARILDLMHAIRVLEQESKIDKLNGTDHKPII